MFSLCSHFYNDVYYWNGHIDEESKSKYIWWNILAASTDYVQASLCEDYLFYFIKLTFLLVRSVAPS